MRNLINHSLNEVRNTAGSPSLSRRFSLAGFINEIKNSALLEAHARECSLSVADIDPQLALDADRDILSAAVANLLQNAFKFTQPRTEVRLNAYASADRIRIDVEDRCGGLPSGDAKKMFMPFAQNGDDKSGLGLGLSITRNSVEANKGILSARDIPGTGCVFTIDLPRFSMA